MKLLCKYENNVTGNVLSFEDFRIFSDLAGGGFAVGDGIDASMIDAGVREEIIAKAVEMGLWTPTGAKTPEQTLYSGIFREIKTTEEPRFRKSATRKGSFEHTKKR